MKIMKQLEITRNNLLKYTKREQLPLKQQNVFTNVIKRLNIMSLYMRWVAEGRIDEGFQDILVEEIKQRAHVLLPYLTDEEVQIVVRKGSQG